MSRRRFRGICLPALALVAVLAGARPALAQAFDLSTAGSEGAPIEIQADEAIEWRREDKVVIARGNAQAVRGNFSVRADTLSAFYKEEPDGRTQIERVEATGNVVMKSDQSTLYGDKAVYDALTDRMVVTGDALRLVTPEQTVTANESMEFDNRAQVAVARGDALVVRGDQRLKADVLTAHLRRGPQGKTEIERLEGVGNVMISTPNEIARSERATYTVDTEIATLTGNVRLTQGKNQLNGASAEVNMKTGVSTLLAGGGGRVRGLFVPQRGETAGAAR